MRDVRLGRTPQLPVPRSSHWFVYIIVFGARCLYHTRVSIDRHVPYVGIYARKLATYRSRCLVHDLVHGDKILGVGADVSAGGSCFGNSGELRRKAPVRAWL